MSVSTFQNVPLSTPHLFELTGSSDQLIYYDPLQINRFIYYYIGYLLNTNKLLIHSIFFYQRSDHVQLCYNFDNYYSHILNPFITFDNDNYFIFNIDKNQFNNHYCFVDSTIKNPIFHFNFFIKYNHHVIFLSLRLFFDSKFFHLQLLEIQDQHDTNKHIIIFHISNFLEYIDIKYLIS